MAEASAGGKKGNTVASVEVPFSKRLRELKKQAENMYKSLQGAEQREWQIPTDYDGDILDVPQLHKPAFDRESLNSLYEQAVQDPANAGTVGDVIALKLQIDYMAMEERAFRARHMSLPRTLCVGHGRRYGQATGGVWSPTSGIEQEIASFIAAGGPGTTA